MRYKQHRVYEWSSEMAYVVGLIASDGSLSKDKRHIDFTSKDFDLVETYREILRPGATIGMKKSGASNIAYRVQLGDVALYDFLLRVGLTPNKSLTLGALDFPDEYFRDFLRGVFDGDGSVYGVWDTRWRNSYMFYTTIASASRKFLEWIMKKTKQLWPSIKCSITTSKKGLFILQFAKQASYELFDLFYYEENVPCLKRKKARYLEIFAINPYPKL